MALTAETIIAADIAITNLISLVYDLLAAQNEDQNIDELKAKADELDAKRKEVMDKIRAH